MDPDSLIAAAHEWKETIIGLKRDDQAYRRDSQAYRTRIEQLEDIQADYERREADLAASPRQLAEDHQHVLELSDHIESQFEARDAGIRKREAEMRERERWHHDTVKDERRRFHEAQATISMLLGGSSHESGQRTTKPLSLQKKQKRLTAPEQTLEPVFKRPRLPGGTQVRMMIH